MSVYVLTQIHFQAAKLEPSGDSSLGAAFASAARGRLIVGERQSERVPWPHWSNQIHCLFTFVAFARPRATWPTNTIAFCATKFSPIISPPEIRIPAPAAPQILPLAAPATPSASAPTFADLERSRSPEPGRRHLRPSRPADGFTLNCGPHRRASAKQWRAEIKTAATTSTTSGRAESVKDSRARQADNDVPALKSGANH